MNFTVRTERQEDSLAVGEVLVRAFNRFDENNLVSALRTQKTFRPELALIGEIGEKTAAYALCTEITLEHQEVSRPCLSLAPVAVLPEYCNKGLASALLKEMIRRAGETDYPCILVLGKPPLYQKCGFTRADQYGIKPPFEIAPDFYRVYFLKETDICGTAHYPDVFGI